MDKEKTLLGLSIELDTIKAHINRMKKGEAELHQLDIDMLKKKTIEFYEQILQLESPANKKIVVEDVKVEEDAIKKSSPEDSTPVKTEKIISETKIEEPIVTKPVIEIEEPQENVESVPEPEQITIVEEKEEPVIEQEVERPIIETSREVKEPVQALKQEEVTEEKTIPELKQTTYDLFSGSADNAVAEKFHLSDEQSIAEKMQKSQIVNIREAIGINEKFLFINELFKGDMGRYNKILDDINDLPTKKGVETYLLEIKVQFQWDENNEAFLKFKELLERKFG